MVGVATLKCFFFHKRPLIPEVCEQAQSATSYQNLIFPSRGSGVWGRLAKVCEQAQSATSYRNLLFPSRGSGVWGRLAKVWKRMGFHLNGIFLHISYIIMFFVSATATCFLCFNKRCNCNYNQKLGMFSEKGLCCFIHMNNNINCILCEQFLDSNEPFANVHSECLSENKSPCVYCKSTFKPELFINFNKTWHWACSACNIKYKNKKSI